jgi:DNA (cytosine-5)-methyltransferase 1
VSDVLAVIRRLSLLDKPLLLDTYCCQGGAAAGYDRAGFAVLGVDVCDQPRYPFTFIQADAIEFILRYGHLFAAVTGSPPCQLYSKTHRINRSDYPDLIGPTREAMQQTGRPHVIENVADALPEMLDPVTLCGAMFGLHTYRHRLFETGGGFSFSPPEHPQHTARTVKMGRPLEAGDFYHAVGNFTNVDYVRQDMDVPWMSRDGVRECIPPAYTQYIGTHLMKHLEDK